MACCTAFLRSSGSAQIASRCFCTLRNLRNAFVCGLAILSCATLNRAQSGTASSEVLAAQSAPTEAQPSAGPTTEAALRRRLVGKMLYLRGRYLNNTLEYDEHGHLISHSPQGSYTLCLVQISRVRLTRHKVLLTGARYGLHFLNPGSSADLTLDFDTINITPRKRPLRISIAREIVIKPKKKKGRHDTPPADADTSASQPGVSSASVTTTTSPAQAAQLLNAALDTVFARNLDDSMIVSLPDFWQRYYHAIAAHSEFRPSDPNVLRQNSVDQPARLLTRVEPASNAYAQANEIAGMALYHVVLDAQGHPQQIAVSRPIGFGLDENAVEAIRRSTFQPAMNDGKPVPVLIDVFVEFRIYSKRTAPSSPDSAATPPAGLALPAPHNGGRP